MRSHVNDRTSGTNSRNYFTRIEGLMPAGYGTDADNIVILTVGVKYLPVIILALKIQKNDEGEP